MVGYNRNELNAQQFCSLFDPKDPQIGNFFYNELIEPENIQYQLEKRLVCKDNSIIWGRLTVSFIKDSRLTSGFLIVMIEDITKRKQMEEALIAEKKRLVITLCSIGDGVITTDIQGKIILVNQIAEDLTGWAQTESIGKPINEVFNIINDDNNLSFDNSVLKVLKNGHVHVSENSILVSRDGLERFISFSIAPIRNSKGEYSGTVLVFRDITEKNKMAEELIKSQKFESMAMLAGGIAHDFNNLLAGILANVQLAEVLSLKGKNIAKNLTDIGEAVKRAAELTKQLFTFAKGGQLTKKTTSIAELIRTTTDFSLRGSNVKCEYSFPPNIWPVEADEGQLSQVVNNLVINAVQSMPDGGNLFIAIENIELNNDSNVPLPKGKYIKISIRDTGIGISDTYLTKIFEPYFTTKDKGSGLGLATSYSIIKNHDGYIKVESTIDIGTTFYIYLPAKGVKGVSKTTKTEKLRCGKGKILVMDDEETIRNTTREILAHLGYSTVVARDGAEVLELYTRAKKAGSKFDAVIMDLTIPGGLGGKETISRLVKIDPAVRAVLASGYADNQILLNYHNYGFRGAVIKPYDMQELSETLHRVIVN